MVKPAPLVSGSTLRVVAPAGPVPEDKLRLGAAELARLGYRPVWNPAVLAREGYFAGAVADRASDLRAALVEPDSAGVIAARGGYGVGYLLEGLESLEPDRPKVVSGFSDLTLLHGFAWHRWSWVTFYGPMAAGAFAEGAGCPGGYDERSFRLAVTKTDGGWSVPLEASAMAEGEAEGVLLGGCLTLLRALLGTPWEPDTAGSILLIEDCNMKPYQVDRGLMHLKLAGKLEDVRGILLGDFPGCDPPEEGGPVVSEVVARLLKPLGVPIVWGAPVGHTRRPLLTLPLGVRVRLVARGAGQLDVLEPAVAPA
ncbi:MAG TPA: LD-carboxypeptidase [Candidatus Acidoferrales bacterium]|nr:LD-carboxypeptidase [Candidatus Acidoferrales bacterium]